MLLLSLPIWASLLLFVLSAAAIWIPGISLSNCSDVLSIDWRVTPIDGSRSVLAQLGIESKSG
jgi:hypothetical protein